MSVELMGNSDQSHEQFRILDQREGLKKVETEKVPDYQDVLNKLISKKEQSLAHQDELSKARYAIKGEKFTGDSVAQFKQTLKSYKKWGLEPNFAGGKTLVPYRIENDGASGKNNFGGQPFDSLEQVNQARSKMEKLLGGIGIDLDGTLKRIPGFERDKLDHTQFTNDKKGKDLYNLQIKYANLLQAGEKEDIIKYVLINEAKKTGLMS